MTEHPGYEPDMRLKSLWLMLEVFRRTHTDLNLELNRFHQFTETKEWWARSREKQLEALQISVRKELMGFSTATAALVYHSRAVKACLEVPDFDAKLKDIFQEGEHRFITGLRNVISHSHYPRVSWLIDYLGDDGRLTDFFLFPSDLLRFADLHRAARTYVEAAGERIHVRKVTDSYASRVNKFYAWLQPRTESMLPESVRDYRRCARAHNATNTRQGWKIALQQYLAKQILDPYEYLDRYLLPAQLEHALSLPHRSKEQVDYIISAVDEYEACDDELRTMVHKLFGVA
jgi:hypothetical protein